MRLSNPQPHSPASGAVEFQEVSPRRRRGQISHEQFVDAMADWLDLLTEQPPPCPRWLSKAMTSLKETIAKQDEEQ